MFQSVNSGWVGLYNKIQSTLHRSRFVSKCKLTLLFDNNGNLYAVLAEADMCMYILHNIETGLAREIIKNWRLVTTACQRNLSASWVRQSCLLIISNVPKCDALPTEDTKIISNWICSRGTTGGETVLGRWTNVEQSKVAEFSSGNSKANNVLGGRTRFRTQQDH